MVFCIKNVVKLRRIPYSISLGSLNGASLPNNKSKVAEKLNSFKCVEVFNFSICLSPDVSCKQVQVERKTAVRSKTTQVAIPKVEQASRPITIPADMSKLNCQRTGKDDGIELILTTPSRTNLVAPTSASTMNTGSSWFSGNSTSQQDSPCKSSDSSYCPTKINFSNLNRETESLNYNPNSSSFKENSLRRVRSLILSNPKAYIGVDQKWLSILDVLSNKIEYHGKLKPIDVIYLVLRKLRLNESFQIIANEFGVTKSIASYLFRRFLPFISDHLKELVFWPSATSIRKCLPVAFRKSYRKVQTVIDCFEIEMEKPSDPVTQALTWSSYKNANTLKYFISITPNGLINFISTGYGGRITDELITSKCGNLNNLTQGMQAMADRGFKKIENLVLAKGAQLVRPPSVKTGVKSTKAQVLLGRKVAGLRIHVERAIRRVREFKYLAPHACTDTHLIDTVDDAVNLVCGLVNLQGSLIK